MVHLAIWDEAYSLACSYLMFYEEPNSLRIALERILTSSAKEVRN